MAEDRRQVDRHPTAAGTREPGPTIVGVIGTDHALWTTNGGWSSTSTCPWCLRDNDTSASGQRTITRPRALMVAERSASAGRTQTINQARALVLTDPDDLRIRVCEHPAGLVAELASLRPRPGAVVGYPTRIPPIPASSGKFTRHRPGPLIGCRIPLACERSSGRDDQQRIRDIRQVLEQAGYTIQPGPHRLANLEDLSNLTTAEGILAPTETKTAC